MRHEAVDRRGFLRNTSSLAAAGASSLWFGGLSDMLGLAGRLGTPRHEVLRAASRPFNMLAFGDSIMWGQGLTHDLKFATLVKNWVETKLPGRGVTFQNFAHSGAQIMRDDAQDAAPGWEGEVPAKFPSIHRQLHRARDTIITGQGNPAEIDLVLLNGGINDIGVTSILSPWASSGSVSDLTRDSITSRMNYLLPVATGLFPNAKFIVPGYFPIITDDSSVPEITLLLAALFGPGAIATPLIRQQLVANCSAFYAESDAGLRNAVAAQNGRTPNRCVYADPGFSAVHGYGASQRYLFNIGETDPMVNARKAYCAAAGLAFDPTCLSASMGHPNVNGAVKYANAMIGKLGVFVTEWQALRKLFACVDPKPVVGSPGNYTVWVEDYETRRPVAASISVGSRTIGANTGFTHTFGCGPAETERLDGVRGRPGRTITVPGACDQILITAPGYVQISLPY